MKSLAAWKTSIHQFILDVADFRDFGTKRPESYLTKVTFNFPNYV